MSRKLWPTFDDEGKVLFESGRSNWASGVIKKVSLEKRIAWSPPFLFEPPAASGGGACALVVDTIMQSWFDKSSSWRKNGLLLSRLHLNSDFNFRLGGLLLPSYIKAFLILLLLPFIIRFSSWVKSNEWQKGNRFASGDSPPRLKLWFITPIHFGRESFELLHLKLTVQSAINMYWWHCEDVGHLGLNFQAWQWATNCALKQLFEIH